MAIVLNGLVMLQAQYNNVTGAILLVFIIAAVWPLASRLSPPRGAPPFLKNYGRLDSPKFSADRANYLSQGKHQSPDGQFSFWHGPNHVIAISGDTARSTYLTSRGLNSTAGFRAIFGGFLSMDSLANHYSRLLLLVYKRCTQDEHMTQNLPHLIADTQQCYEQIGHSKVINPVDTMGRLVYQLTHRMVGTHDIADNPKLIDETRAVYKPLEESSVFDLCFPLIPTPSKLKKLWGYTSLHWSLQSIVTNRRQTGRIENDAMQMMMDQEMSGPLISLGIIGAILAGVFNTSISAAYNLCYLAHDPDWMARIQTEVDTVIERHRISQSESVVDTLQRLTLKEWESEFPLLELALKETLRFVMSGTIVRKNIGSKDVPIGNTGSVIPRNSLAVYSSADAHMDGRIYKDPSKWDPSRHDQRRAEGMQTPHSFLGWGSGNHPCPAMRFAKLDVIVPTVMLIASYDFEMCDLEGTKVVKPLPELQFDRVGAGRPSDNVYMKCSLRVRK